MALWRERGYVPDSDEDEEFESQQDRVVEQPGPSQPVADRNDELSSPKDIRDGKDNDQNNDARSVQKGLPGPENASCEISPVLDPSSPQQPTTHPDELDDDPLQAPDGILSRVPGWRKRFYGPVSNSHSDPPSSPDQLQFEEFRPRRPKTPPRKSFIDPDGLISDMSSPLSSLSTVSRIHSPRPTPEQYTTDRTVDHEPEPENINPIQYRLSLNDEANAHTDWISGRAFRQRTAIQLRPYTVEKAQYHNLLHGSGIKPIQVSTNERSARKEPDESQNQEFQDESFPLPSSLASLPFPSSSPPACDPLIPAPLLAKPFEATPRGKNIALSKSVKSRSNQATNAGGTKRRKLDHSSGGSKAGNQVIDEQTNVTTQDNNAGSSENPVTGNFFDIFDIFDVPISPPPSDGLHSSHSRDVPTTFRFPRHYTPNPLITPVTQKKQTTNATEIIPITSSPIRDPDSQRPASVYEISDGSDTSGPQEDSFNIRQVQRRMKGVLPASFARLDREKHEEQMRRAAERDRIKLLERQRPSGRGVARRISPKTKPTENAIAQRKHAFLSDDSESDDTITPTIARQAQSNFREPETLDRFFEIDDDIPEDNRIDYMAPPSSRRPRKKRKANNNTLKSQWSKHAARGPSSQLQPLNSPVKRQKKITDTLTYSRKVKPRKPRPPRLSILDANDFKGRHTEAQPQFLRVAARNARARRDKGRQSPSRKVLRLATITDTLDANASLRNWRTGKLKPKNLVNRAKEHPQPPRLSPGSPSGYLGVSVAPDQHGPSFRVEAPQPIIDLDSDNPPEPTSPARILPSHRAGVPRRRANWVVNRKSGPIPIQPNVPRPARLDDVELPTGYLQRLPSFRTGVSALNSAYRKCNGGRNLPLSRFLEEQLPLSEPVITSRNLRTAHEAQPPIPGNDKKQRRVAQKKQTPRRIDAEAFEYRQPQEYDAGNIESIANPTPESEHQTFLNGLHPANKLYSLDFDIRPLRIGTYYHESTFIGSGEFARSLSLLTRDLDTPGNYTTFNYGGKSYKWGPWNDTVSSELGELMGFIGIGSNTDAQAHSQALSVYKSVVLYVTKNLSFMDPIDRPSFIARCADLLLNLDRSACQAPDFRTSVEMYILVFANQLYQIGKHESVAPSKLDLIVRLIKLSASRILESIYSKTGMQNVQKFLEDNTLLNKREAGARDEYPFVDAYVVLHSILRQIDMKETTLESQFLSMVCKNTPHTIHDLETHWKSLFNTIPLQEVDSFGILRPGSRFQFNLDQWDVVEHLMAKVLTIWQDNTLSQNGALQNYIRVIFQRCFVLTKNWGWRQGGLILSSIFKFYTANSLLDIEKEQVHGSPRFLDELPADSALELESKDSCFHIFLKLIALVLRHMKSLAEHKQIRNLIWKLLPNHGRMYPKEEPLRLEELGALRNHHDLLSALYCSAPKECRPPIKPIRNLVHPPSSHRGACSINIHTWSRLVRFTLATDENTPDLKAFSEWHGDFTSEILHEHAQIRRLIEADDPSASIFRRRYIEETIVQNERQIESLIEDSLTCLTAAIRVTKNIEQAVVLMENFPGPKLFGLYNPKVKRLDSVVRQTLDVLITFAELDNRPSLPITTKDPAPVIEPSEDSQDFGSWDGIYQAFDEQVETTDAGALYLNKILPLVFRFVSTCFGQDSAPEDSILSKAIDCWVAVACIRVKNGQRQWTSYFNRYDEESWPSLRSTDQTRRFMPYFLSKLVTSTPSPYSQNRAQILAYWSESLVERGLFLKYQHDITNSLLNEDREDPLFRNLPFVVNKATGKYNISLTEFCQRRISLISGILSNMREHISEIESGRVQPNMNVVNIYQNIVRAMMAAMKQNCQDLAKAESLLRGSYIEFVHQVVKFLQEHSQAICPLDPYFMDPSSFPLPVSDPTYVVAKLKRYGLQLSTTKVAKQLVIFIQSVCERAAVDMQQMYLVDQLYEAMSNSFETGGYTQPTLRSFLLQCVVPVYIKASISNPAGWIVALPLLQATTRVFANLILDLDSTKEAETRIIIDSMIVYFDAVYRSLQPAVSNPDRLHDAPCLLILTSFLETVVSSLSVIDYLARLNSGNVDRLINYIDYFGKFYLFAIAIMFDPSTANPPVDILATNLGVHTDDSENEAPPTFFDEARKFTTRELDSWLQDYWSMHGGNYYVRRGSRYTEVGVNPNNSSIEVVRSRFIKMVGVFFGCMEALDTFSEDIR
ncbi:hypothetical protein FQN57_005129 [Myotisia sp. PD_48]|nr:hypothetical protein FQN57_005129 [Myotisia sp. PD_48]